MGLFDSREDRLNSLLKEIGLPTESVPEPKYSAIPAIDAISKYREFFEKLKGENRGTDLGRAIAGERFSQWREVDQFREQEFALQLADQFLTNYCPRKDGTQLNYYVRASDYPKINPHTLVLIAFVREVTHQLSGLRREMVLLIENMSADGKWIAQTFNSSSRVEVERPTFIQLVGKVTIPHKPKPGEESFDCDLTECKIFDLAAHKKPRSLLSRIWDKLP